MQPCKDKGTPFYRRKRANNYYYPARGRRVWRLRSENKAGAEHGVTRARRQKNEEWKEGVRGEQGRWKVA